jgi:hypothetical protein
MLRCLDTQENPRGIIVVLDKSRVNHALNLFAASLRKRGFTDLALQIENYEELLLAELENKPVTSKPKKSRKTL